MTPGCPTCPETSLAPRFESSVGALRSALVALAGGILLCAGVVALFLPVPGVLLIALGLSVLATRFQVARRWQDALKHALKRPRSAAAKASAQAGAMDDNIVL